MGAGKVDEFLKNTYCYLFKYWILGQKIKGCTITLKNDNYIALDSSKYHGIVYFHPMEIIELKIENVLDHNTEFYLHFQMNNFNHAMQLFEEMKECLEQLEKEKAIKVLLSCSGGLTTSYFAELLNETAQMLNLNVHVDACAYEKITKNIDAYDIVFLAPQIAYQIARLKQVNNNVPVLTIPSQIFAKYDTKGFFDLLFEELAKINRQEKVAIQIKKKTKKKKSVLCIAIFRDRRRIHILYRLYDRDQNLILDNEIIKLNISILDISDIIGYVIASYHDLDIIGISSPGFVDKKGMLVSTYLDGLDNCLIMNELSQQYKQKIYIYNDVNCAAAGYYASQNKYENLAFIFQPVNHYSGAGLIINGKLIQGQANLAGEIQYASRHLKTEYFLEEKTKQQIVDILLNDVLLIISVIDPDLIVIYTELVTDLKLLETNLKEKLPEDSLPIIKKVGNFNEYDLIGLLHLCLSH